MSLDYRTFQSAGKISSHIIPGAYSRVDSIKGAGGLASSNNGVVMGQSTGGEPNVLYQFNTVAEAEVLGEADNDTVNLDPDSTSGSIKIDGQGGEDDVNVTLGATVAGKIGGPISVLDTGATGIDKLYVTGGNALSDYFTINANNCQLIFTYLSRSPNTSFFEEPILINILLLTSRSILTFKHSTTSIER